MPVYKSVGNLLSSERKLKERTITKGPVPKIIFSKKPSPVIVSSHIPPGGKNPQKFIDIRLGKPMSVMIRHIYTGRHGGFGADMLLTSAMKSIATYNAMPRAVNFLVKGIAKKKHLSNPDATGEGTPIVFYTPALTEENTIVTFELILDRIPGEIFDNISRAFNAFSGIPIFASKAAGLLATGVVMQIVKKVLNMIFDGKPVLNATEKLYFNLGGAVAPDAGFYLVSEEKIEEKILMEHHINEEGKLVRLDDPKKEYEGDDPYLIISIDGREYQEYKKFIPTAASAALLEKFYNIKEGLGPIDVLIEATTLYNDIQFKKRSDVAWGELKKLKKDTVEYNKKKDEYDAYIANILNEEIKKIVTDRA